MILYKGYNANPHITKKAYSNNAIDLSLFFYYTQPVLPFLENSLSALSTIFRFVIWFFSSLFILNIKQTNRSIVLNI